MFVSTVNNKLKLLWKEDTALFNVLISAINLFLFCFFFVFVLSAVSRLYTLAIKEKGNGPD